VFRWLDLNPASQVGAGFFVFGGGLVEVMIHNANYANGTNGANSPEKFALFAEFAAFAFKKR